MLCGYEGNGQVYEFGHLRADLPVACSGILGAGMGQGRDEIRTTQPIGEGEGQ